MRSILRYFIFFLPSDTFHVTRYTQKFTHFQEIFIFYNFHFVANLVFFTPKWSRITKLILWKVWDLEVKPSRRYSLAKALESKMAAWLCYSSRHKCYIRITVPVNFNHPYWLHNKHFEPNDSEEVMSSWSFSLKRLLHYTSLFKCARWHSEKSLFRHDMKQKIPKLIQALLSFKKYPLWQM